MFFFVLFFFVFCFFFVSNVLISYPDTKAKYELGVFGVTFPCKGHRRGKYVVARMKWEGEGGGGWGVGRRGGEIRIFDIWLVFFQHLSYFMVFTMLMS